MSTEADQARQRRIGLLRHALKTGLAAFASFHFTAFVGLDFGYWAVISAIIVMQADLGGSLAAGLNRVAGTVAGAAVAMAGMALFGPSSWLLFASVVFVIGFCSLIPGLRESYRMAGVTVAIVILAAPPGIDVVTFGFHRCLEILVGVGVAVGVSFLIWPSRAQYSLKRELGEQFADMADMTLSLTGRFLSDTQLVSAPSVEQLVRRMAANPGLLFQARREASLFGKIGLRPLFLGADRLQSHLKGMDRLAVIMPPDGYQTHCSGELRGLASATAKTLSHMAGELGGRPEVGPWPDPSQARAAAEAKLLELRTHDAAKSYPLGDIATFFSFYQHLRGLADETIRMGTEIRRLRA